jgi:hypothetical protein
MGGVGKSSRLSLGSIRWALTACDVFGIENSRLEVSSDSVHLLRARCFPVLAPCVSPQRRNILSFSMT